MFFRQDPSLSIPRNDEDGPLSTTQDAFGNRTLSEPPPPSSSVGSQNDEIDFPGVCMKHDDAGGITVLLFDVHLYACRLCTFPKVGQVFEPLACARGKSNLRRGCMKQKQLGVANDCEPERAVKRWFARLLEIDRAKNAREVPHASSIVIRSSRGAKGSFNNCQVLPMAAYV